jgi:hypothetical protein
METARASDDLWPGPARLSAYQARHQDLTAETGRRYHDEIVLFPFKVDIPMARLSELVLSSFGCFYGA